MFYRSRKSFVTLHWFLAKLLALKLSKFQRSSSFPDFFSKRLQILTWFLACKSITMFYRSSLSFVTLHWFWAKSRTLDLVNFSDQTVFCNCFLNARRYWADFWHVSQSSSWSFIAPHWFLAEILALDLVNFIDGIVFQTFFLYPCRFVWFLACKSTTSVLKSKKQCIQRQKHFLYCRGWLNKGYHTSRYTYSR